MLFVSLYILQFLHIAIIIMDPCIHCNQPVRQRQQGLQCDGCQLWQHRTCNTGVTQEQYRAAVRGAFDLEWSCLACTNSANDGRYTI